MCFYHFVVKIISRGPHSPPRQLCLVLYSFCASFFCIQLQWLIFSSLSYFVAYYRFCYYVIEPNGVVLCYYLRIFNFSFEISLSYLYSHRLVGDFFSLSLEVSMQLFFFPFRRSSLSFFYINITIAAIGWCNNYFFARFNIFIESLYWCL